jgi:hypothetical protein
VRSDVKTRIASGTGWPTSDPGRLCSDGRYFWEGRQLALALLAVGEVLVARGEGIPAARLWGSGGADTTTAAREPGEIRRPFWTGRGPRLAP